MISNQQIDEVRAFARFGAVIKVWNFHERRLYEESAVFVGSAGEHYTMLHEYKLLFARICELYAVIVLFGVEYTINLGGPCIDGYTD